jgi:hypothetical protein
VWPKGYFNHTYHHHHHQSTNSLPWFFPKINYNETAYFLYHTILNKLLLNACNHVHVRLIFYVHLYYIQYSFMLACKSNGSGPHRRSNNTKTAYLLLFCNGMVWWEGDKGMKWVKERKKCGEEWWWTNKRNMGDRRIGDKGVKGRKEKKKGDEGWRYERNQFLMNFNGDFTHL